MHTFAYYLAIGQTPLSDCPIVIDDVFSVSNGHFLLPKPRKIFTAYAGSGTLTLAQIKCPAYNLVSPLRILPFNVGAVPTNNPNILDLSQTQATLPALEEISVQATSGIVTGTEPFYAVINTYETFMAAPSGQIYSYHGTSTTASVVGSWTSSPVTWDTSLPSGTFAVVGATVEDATGVAYRLIFPGQADRPGGLTISSFSNRSFPGFRTGGQGILGLFSSTTLPTLQILGSTSSTARDVTLDIVKVA